MMAQNVSRGSKACFVELMHFFLSLAAFKLIKQSSKKRCIERFYFIRTSRPTHVIPVNITNHFTFLCRMCEYVSV